MITIENIKKNNFSQQQKIQKNHKEGNERERDKKVVTILNQNVKDQDNI